MHFLRRLILCGQTGVDVYANSNYRFADWSQPPPIDEPEQIPTADATTIKSNKSIGYFFKSRSNRQAGDQSENSSLVSETSTRTKSTNSGRSLYAISSKAKYQGNSDFEVTEFLQSVVDDESSIREATFEKEASGEKTKWWYAVLSKEEAWEVANSEFVCINAPQCRLVSANEVLLQVKSCDPVCLNSF